MPAATPCPIPGIDSALAPYIASREETLRIRNTLSRYLASGLRTQTWSKSHHLQLQCPLNASVVPLNLPGLTGKRRQYLEALRRHHAAKSRHQELQRALQELQRRQGTGIGLSESTSTIDTSGVHEHVMLVQQRRRLAELQVIYDTLDKLVALSPVNGHLDMKTLVHDAIGEQPDIPARSLELLTNSTSENPYIIKLKKEVIEAKDSLDRAQAARKAAQQSTPVPATTSLHVQVQALDVARIELVNWISDELAKMEEGSSVLEEASPLKRQPNDSVEADASSLDVSLLEAKIREAYNAYVSSRSNLVESHESLEQPVEIGPPKVKSPSGTSKMNAPLANTDAATPALMLLPHLSELCHLDQTERSQHQLVTYLQTQIAAADEELASSLQRLAGESHLLRSAAKDTGAWATAAKEAMLRDEQFCHQAIRESRNEIKSVAGVLELASVRNKLLASTRSGHLNSDRTNISIKMPQEKI